jgi:class 3 adenylate cyclase
MERKLTAILSADVHGYSRLIGEDEEATICTRTAFVGNVDSGDCLMWTAIGNTPKLAAQLQSLTQRLEAAIAIDRATWAAAGEVATDFTLHAQLRIRGHQRAEDVYVLPLATPAVPAQHPFAARS